MERIIKIIFRFYPLALILGSMLLMAAPLRAQLVFIPDVDFRNALNLFSSTQVVDANGFMDTTSTAVTQLTGSAVPLIINWPSSDLTGLQYFDSLTDLEIWYEPIAVSTAVPPLPSSVTYFKIKGSPSATLPGLPAGPMSLHIERCGFNSLPQLPQLGNFSLIACPNIAQIPVLPAGVTGLTLDSLPALTAWPAMPNSLFNINLYRIPLTQLPVLPAMLDYLTMEELPLTSLPVWPVNITKLYLRAIPVNSLPALPASLNSLKLVDMPLSSVDPLGLNVTSVDYGNLPITSLPAWPSNMQWINLFDLSQLASLPSWPGGNAAPSIWLTDLPLIQAIPAFPDSLMQIQFKGLPGVTTIPDFGPMYNGVSLWIEDFANLTHITAWPTAELTKFVQNCPMLTCIPYLPPPIIDPFNAVNVLNTGITCAPNERVIDMNTGLDLPICTVLNSNCPDIWPAVTGTVFHDQNNNGVLDGGEQPYPNVTIEASPGNHMTASQSDGSFLINFPPGNYTVDALPSLYQTVSTQPYTASVPNFGTIDSLVQFGIYTFPNIQDLRAHMHSYPARPGFNNLILMQAENVGTKDTIPVMTFTFDSDQTWVSSVPAPDLLVGNTATWTGPSITPGSGFHVDVILHTDSLVPLGTLIDHTLVVDPAVTDTTPTDNTILWNDSVVGSYDPNDKLLIPAVMTPADVQAGQTPIEYTIRFQNTGTYQAERVVVLDTLSTDLQWNSFEFIGSSHPCNWYMFDGVLHFIFDPIILPDNTSDEPNSHGFVKFSILPSDQLQNGETVENIAHIVFDFNEPIVTPPAVFTVDVLAFVAEAQFGDVSIFPNPATNEVTLKLPSEWDPRGTLKVQDALGREVMNANFRAHSLTLLVTDLPPGVYLLTMNVGTHSVTERFLKTDH